VVLNKIKHLKPKALIAEKVLHAKLILLRCVTKTTYKVNWLAQVTCSFYITAQLN